MCQSSNIDTYDNLTDYKTIEENKVNTKTQRKKMHFK